MAAQIDNSGFCKSNSTFYSKRSPLSLPQNSLLDLTTFISSQPHHGTIAYIDASTGHHLTFPQVWEAVDSLSTFLSSFGIRKGDVILILSPNSIYFPIVCLSVMSLGAIITTTNPLNTVQEIHKQNIDSEPVLAFTTHSLLSKLSPSSTLPIILINDDENSKQNSTRVISCLPEILKMQPASEARFRERVHQDDTASLLYSSGTTGTSKGVISSHGNLIATVQTIMQRFGPPRKKETFICTIPMFHIYGLTVFACGLLAAGSTIVILPRFDPDAMFRSIEKYRATYLPVAPPILVGMINNGEVIKRKYDLSSLEWVFSGGAPLSKEVTKGFVEMYPTVKVGQGYALTETAGIGAGMNTVEESKRYGTVGLLSAGLEAKIVDPESGEALGVNRRGELWLRGPTVMKGYFNNSEATASTLDTEGWLKTGDLCYVDDDGYIFVVDRLKELIKYKGYQVAPAELEALLLSHPEIDDAAVIPFPDNDVGQYPMAYIVRNPGSNLSESGVMDFVRAQVASYKRVRRVSFVSTIPKTPSGKILRKDLIKLAISHL